MASSTSLCFYSVRLLRSRDTSAELRSSEEALVEGKTTCKGFCIFPDFKRRRWEDNTDLFESGTALINNLTELHQTKGKHRETCIGTNVFSLMLAANVKLQCDD